VTTDVQMPARRWGDEAPTVAPVPIVLVSSRDEAPVPAVPGAVRFARAIEAAGWAVRQTYAVADVPASGRTKAHRLHSIAVRFRRAGDFAGYATWYRRDEGAWRFMAGYLGLAQHGLRDLTARLTAHIDGSGRPAAGAPVAPAGNIGGEVVRLTGADLPAIPRGDAA
jgi:hypothetical protein